MNLSLTEKLTMPKELLVDLAISKEDNPYNEDVYLLYNPEGYGGVLTVGKEIVDLINLFDGTIDLASAIKLAGFSTDEREMVKGFVEVLVENQMLVSSKKIDNKKSWKKALTCWLHITNDCNLRCKYCYIHKSRDKMCDSIVFETIDKMLESCKRNNIPNLEIMLVGGEPLTRFDLIQKIVDYCSKNKGDINVGYTIPTNGTLITPEVAKYIVEHKMTVGVSIDGVEQYHDKNRVKVDGTGSYKLAMRGVDNLIAEGVKPSIMVTVTKENLDGLPQLTKMLIEKKIFFRFSFERDTATGNPSILQDEKHCIDVLKQCFDIMKQSLVDGKTGWFFKFGDVTFSKPVRRACAAGKNFFAVGQDGSVGSCSLGLEMTKANIRDLKDVAKDIEDIFSEIGSTSACDVKECSKCLWRHSCAGACVLQTYATYKTCMHVSPYCNLYKACLPDVIRILALTIYYNSKKEE